MHYDQEAAAATISDTLASVKSVAQPGTTLSSLSPVFTLSPGARFKVQPSPLMDISKPVKLTLINDKGAEKDWTITVIKTGSRNNIDTLSLPAQLSYQRDTINKTIHVLVNNSIDLHNTSFTSFVADRYSIVSPVPASVKDFSNPQTFLITAENGNVAQWTVTVDRKLSSANDILALSLAGQLDTAHINDINKVITVRSNVLKTSILSIKVSDGATLMSPLVNTIDFTKQVVFVVKAEDGTLANWDVNVTQLPFNGFEAIKLYPMPAITTLSVLFKMPLQTESSIALLSVYGRTLFSKNFSGDGSLPLAIDVSNYPDGIYILSITNSGHVYTQKVIIKR